MMDIYTEHHPHHEIGPVEHLKYVGAQYYTTLLSRLTSHIKNEDVHVSNEDRDKWDNKADKAALRELEMKIAELTPSSDKDDIDLSDYATREWVRDQNYVMKGQCPTYEDLSNLNKLYALKTEIPSVDGLATEKYVDDAIASIKPGGGSDMSGYATQSLVLQLAQKDEFLDLKINGLQDQVDAIDEYTLPTASNTEKGGIKTGYAPVGNGNYPVLISGEYAYVNIPFSTTGGDDIVVTSMYNIEVVSNTLKLTKGTQPNQPNVLDGSVVWKVSQVQGSSYSYVMPDAEGISTSASLLPASGVTLAYNTTRDGNYVGYAQSIQVASADYVVITVQKNGSVVARQVVPIQNPGSDGTTTVRYLNLEYPVIRLAGEYNFNTQYNDGAYNENGVYYIDIVSCEDALYKAINPGGNRGGLTQRPHPERDQGWDEYWEPFSIYGQAAFYNLLVANLAFIRSLAANQVVVVDSNNEPVAGLLSNDSTITTLSGTYSRQNIRIFAGGLTDGNIETAPFRVYDDGRVAIEKGSFTATNDDASASLDVFNDRGALMPMLKLTDGQGDMSELTDEHLIIENRYGDRTTIAGDKITTPGLDVNGTLNIVGSLLLNGNPIGGSSEGTDLWLEITGSDAYYTFKIQNGVLAEVYRNTDSESLAAVGDRILWLNIQNGNSRAYRKTANGQGAAW